jgi:hypothetical protein
MRPTPLIHFSQCEILSDIYAQIMPVGFMATVMPKEGVYVDGLQLSNAGWDSSRGALTELLPGEEVSLSLPPVWIRPVPTSRSASSGPKATDSAPYVYLCPLFSCASMDLQQDSSLISHILLPSLHPSTLWAQKRVALTRRC